MLAYVVCAEAAWDSYHSLVAVTLDKDEAETMVASQNARHDPECIPHAGKECGCIRYHMHEVPVKGIMPRIRKLIQAAQELGVMSELSGLPQD